MTADRKPFFQTRGIVLHPADIATWQWPEKAKAAGLTTIATHQAPHVVVEFVQSEEGRRILEKCRKLGLEVEHELHAMNELLPRKLFEKDPTMFRMNEDGDRAPDANLCVHSAAAVETVCESAVSLARILRPTTGRHFFWIDDAQPMCRCPKCRGLSDSDQALILENAMIQVLRETDPKATLAHLAYSRTLEPPAHVKPEPGVFLEFAPIVRRFDAPLSRRDARFDRPGAPTHGEQLDLLDANLDVFGRENAQALEYWMDVSLFCRLAKKDLVKLPWNREVFLDDLETYAKRGVRHVTSFGVYIHGEYVKRYGEPPLDEYGTGLLEREAS
ncbi:MAG TPA: DUF4838 domain-containing protein [Sumerlaeia bacterium]|nr:DUF4838 domain-containing protein [Sumerlaeia bacterium]